MHFVLRRFATVMLAAVFTVSALSAAQAKIVIQEKTKFYSVKGKTGRQLTRSMVANGPKGKHLRNAVAATEVKFDFLQPSVGVRNGRCVLKDITVKLSLTYIYPKWRSPGGSSADVRRAWKAFYAEVVRHEKTHGRIAKKYASRVEKQLKRMSGTLVFKCRDFGNWSKMGMQLLANQMKAEQRSFDRREQMRTSKIYKLEHILFASK